MKYVPIALIGAIFLFGFGYIVVGAFRDLWLDYRKQLHKERQEAKKIAAEYGLPWYDDIST